MNSLTKKNVPIHEELIFSKEHEKDKVELDFVEKKWKDCGFEALNISTEKSSPSGLSVSRFLCLKYCLMLTGNLSSKQTCEQCCTLVRFH